MSTCGCPVCDDKGAAKCTKFDPTKPVQTRDGRPARILCSDLRSQTPIVAAIVYANTEEGIALHYPDGRKYKGCSDPFDLVNIKTKKWQWVVSQKFHTEVTDYWYTEKEIKKWCEENRFNLIDRILETEREE